ncbi:hypothetical protein HN51_069483 [Arachis hypogaea]|uniref:uncharacterized protein LOC107643423 n=1 Tax=Arachis ipaensis TaxID=130454 RepID=UPI0007AF375C|nr:uncharacterized protein LOC107643423 [Arachis ipaensis]XP_025654518.1 uncharacterized protein LOC112750159 [Arachis hypogaea]QHO11761.1 uncharacterized protein DS421_15g501000 [Arachis hypogaea]QHO11762.1 uncharacterized protein DS421_15g501000 [Arachis hypogaea]
MEFFTKAKAVKLRSHLDKYLVADRDLEKVHQSRKGDTRRAKWIVEVVNDDDINGGGGSHRVRLRSCHGRYLAATETPFLLGMTGNRVVQAEFDNSLSWKFEWEPVRDGFQVRLRSWCGKFLRGNGATLPWRNTVTHDDPVAGISSGWVLWDVEAVELPEEEEDDEVDEYASLAFSDEFSAPSDPSSPMSVFSLKSPPVRQASKLGQKTTSNNKFRNGMDFFRHAKAVRLRSHHDKYLIAEDDEETVTQDRNGASKSARWHVEYVDSYDNIIRLKSCYGKYLTASTNPFLLGMTGRKVLQTLPSRLDSSVEWEPVKDGGRVKLKTRYGNFLRANGGVPPWRNSVTHDIPHRTATQDWVLWDVDVVEIHVRQSPTTHKNEEMAAVVENLKQPSAPPLPRAEEEEENLDERLGMSNAPSSRKHAKSGSFLRQWSNMSGGSSPKVEGRTIYYHVAEDNGEVTDEGAGYSLNFKGNGVEELTRKFEEETGLEGIIVCNRSPLNGKLYPLRLQLPPNNVTMQVVLVLPYSQVARDFEAQGLI